MISRLIVVIFSLLSFCHFALAGDGIAPSASPDDLASKIAVGVISSIVGAVLAFIYNLYLTRRREEREEHREIVYSTDMQSLQATGDEGNNDIRLVFKDAKYKKLTVASVTLNNTGNRIIKDYYVRFEFAPSAKILHAEYTPADAAENPISADGAYKAKQNEARYLMQHFARDASATFRFVIADSGDAEPRLHGRNDENVDLIFGQTTTDSRDDSQTLNIFLSLLFVFFFAPHLFDFIPDNFRFFSPAGLIRSVVSALIIINLSSFTKAIRRQTLAAWARHMSAENTTSTSAIGSHTFAHNVFGGDNISISGDTHTPEAK